MENPDPFLYTETKICTGQGRAIVCCVGHSCYINKNRKKADLVIKEQKTELEDKLENVANKIRKYAIFATILSVVTHLVFMILKNLFTQDDFFSNKALIELLNIGIIAAVLMLVAIPEGLPLAVSIAMALSISRLKKDNILIKNLEAIQSSAMLHDLCVGKTGILTEGKMNVKKYMLGQGEKEKDRTHDSVKTPSGFVKDSTIHPEVKNLVIESILNNTNVRIEYNDKDFTY